METYSVIGKSLPRLDANVKATGEAKFAADYTFPGMLYGKLLKSPYAHARIKHIDTSKAKKLKGVRSVVTGDDTYKLKNCIINIPPYMDWDPLAVDKVRHIGDEVAAVAAVSEDIAEEAIDLIEVEYEELPAVFDPFEAMKPGAPQIHEGKEGNISVLLDYHLGDVDKAFEACHHIREDEFHTHAVQHAAMEPHGTIAQYDSSGKMTVWTATQCPFILHRDMAYTLKMPESQVRVIKTHTGGGFGGKGELFGNDYAAALLSMKTGKPVKMVMTREEVFTNTRFRHPAHMNFKTGVNKDGLIQAFEFKVVFDGGAYNSTAPLATYLFTSFILLAYRTPNYHAHATRVYTNKPYSGAMRGHMGVQGRFAFDQQLDMIGEDIGLDPLEIRYRNAIQENDLLVNKSQIRSCGLTDCIKESSAHADWKKKEPNKGVGIACGGFCSGANISPPFDATGAMIKAQEDGAVTLITGTADIGQGAETVLAMIVAEELGIELDDVRVIAGDTEITPYEPGTFSSRVTVHSGNAAKAAATDIRNQLFEIVAEKLEANVEDMTASHRMIHVKGSPERGIPFRDAVILSFFEKDKAVFGQGSYKAKLDNDIFTGMGNMSPTYSFASHVAEVDVDPETGMVGVPHFIAAHDCGRVLNPMAVEGQLEGTVAMGHGYTMFENIYMDKGRVLNANFLDYKLGTSLDYPGKVTSLNIEALDDSGPFGAKEAGEGTILPVAPAIANAVYDATGIRVTELPIAPDKLLKAMKEKNKQ